MSKRKTPPTLAAASGADFASESAAAMLRAFEAAAQIQQRTFAESLSRRHAALDGAASDPMKFALAQADLMRQDMEATVRCCKELAEAAIEAQNEIAACCARLNGSDAVLQAAHALD